MRIIASIFIFTLVLALSSCSFSSHFFVINNSSEPIMVRYKIKKEHFNKDNLFLFVPKPATIAVKDLGNDAPRELTSEQYKVLIETRTIIVTVQPNEALRVETLNNYSEHDKESSSFRIEDIAITGSNGEIQFSDEQAQLAFIQSKKYFSLTYK